MNTKRLAFIEDFHNGDAESNSLFFLILFLESTNSGTEQGVRILLATIHFIIVHDISIFLPEVVSNRLK